MPLDIFDLDFSDVPVSTPSVPNMEEYMLMTSYFRNSTIEVSSNISEIMLMGPLLDAMGNLMQVKNSNDQMLNKESNPNNPPMNIGLERKIDRIEAGLDWGLYGAPWEDRGVSGGGR
jgi:hypothetical protein